MEAIFSWLWEVFLYLTASPSSRIRQRAALLALDDRLLDDIGITRDEVLRGRPRTHHLTRIQHHPAKLRQIEERRPV